MEMVSLKSATRQLRAWAEAVTASASSETARAAAIVPAADTFGLHQGDIQRYSGHERVAIA